MITPRSITSLRNPAFEKALGLLAHPACLAALALLLINDHLLRRWWPSWWTGKIGDLAWLLIAPFALAAVLAWLLPLREPARERWVFPLAFGLTGVGFAALKMSPVLMDVAIRNGSAALRTPLTILPDPADLLALPVLALAFLLWRKAPARPRRTAAGLIALPMAAMLTLANAAMPDPGISCFVYQDGQILASAAYTTFASQDGGLTWKTAEMGSRLTCEPGTLAAGQWQEAPGPSPEIRYRYQPGAAIQISTNGGGTWQNAYSLEALSEAQQMYFIKSHPGNPEIQPGPLHALADPSTGNMLFAMGHQGVLIHTTGGAWVWSAVDGYHTLDPFPTADAASVLLGGMLYLAAGLALLIYATLALRLRFHWLRLAAAALAWTAWLAVNTLFPPAASYGYTLTMTTAGTLGMFVLLIPLCIELTIRLARRSPRLLAALAAFGLLGGLLYLLPYVLWLYSTLPGIAWAAGFALALAAAVLKAGFLIFRRALTPS